MDSPKFFQVLKECAVEGFQLMLVDVAVQMSTSVTNYMAASDHFETAFKLGAAECILVVRPTVSYANHDDGKDLRVENNCRWPI